MGSASRGNRLAASCVGLPPSSGRMQLGRFSRTARPHARIHEQSIGSAICSEPAVALFLGLPAPPKSDPCVARTVFAAFAACVFDMPGLTHPPKHLKGGAHFKGTIGRLRRSRLRAIARRFAAVDFTQRNREGSTDEPHAALPKSHSFEFASTISS